MKKTYTSILSLAGLMGSLLLTSCLGDSGSNKFYSDGIFSVVEDGSYSFFADYGGLVQLSLQSASDLKKNGLKNGDRIYMAFQYNEEGFRDMPGKGKYIVDAEFVSGQKIPKQNILKLSEAESANIMDKDSLFTITSSENSFYLGAYRGYLTARYNGIFSVISGKGILPTLNFVYDPAENVTPNELKLKMCYNRHSAKDTSSSTETFFATYPLSYIPIAGQDSITITIEGLSKPRTLKIGREDMMPGNYEYFK